MNKITPFLWFDTEAEEAMKFYVSIFKNSKVIGTQYYPDAMPGRGGQLMSATFELDGQRYMTLNAGPEYKFTEAISMFVSCEDQTEVDEYWNQLVADGGEEGNCGWLKDKYGLSWQIVPKALGEFLGNSDQTKSGRALQAMLKMHKISVSELQAAFDGE